MRNHHSLLRLAALALGLSLAIVPVTHAGARRSEPRVFSITGADCGDCGTMAINAVKKLRRVRRVTFDRDRVELSVIADSAVKDATIIAAIENSGEPLHATVGAGTGRYLPFPDWPEGTDVQVLTRDGEAVGPLESLLVPGKWTVFDVYADWCGPCRVVDAHLRDASVERKDIAVRKLNVKRFDTPLARELGAKLRALPYVVVFAPDGRRTDIVGAELERITAALATR